MKAINKTEVSTILMELSEFKGSFDKKYYRALFLQMQKRSFSSKKSVSYIFPLDAFDYAWLKGLALRGYRIGLNINPKTNRLRVKLQWRKCP